MSHVVTIPSTLPFCITTREPMFSSFIVAEQAITVEVGEIVPTFFVIILFIFKNHSQAIILISSIGYYIILIRGNL